MNLGVLLLLFSLTIVVLYLVFHFKISTLIEDYFQKKYRAYILHDMQEFYREMETYSLMFDSKIKIYKNLITHNDRLIKDLSALWEKIHSDPDGKTMQVLMEKISNKKDEHENKVLDAINVLEKKININTQSKLNATKDIMQDEPQQQKHKISQNPSNDYNFILNEDLLLPDSIDSEILSTNSPLVERTKHIKTKPIITKQNNRIIKESDSNISLSKITSTVLKSIGSIFGEFMGVEQISQKTPIATESNQKTNIISDTTHKNLDIEKEKFMNFIQNSNQTKYSNTDHYQKNIANKQVNSTIQKSTLMPNQIITKDTDDFHKLLEALKAPLKRPSALRKLLKQDYTIDELALLSQVTESELFATKRIYNL